MRPNFCFVQVRPIFNSGTFTRLESLFVRLTAEPSLGAASPLCLGTGNAERRISVPIRNCDVVCFVQDSILRLVFCVPINLLFALSMLSGVNSVS